MFMKVFKGLNFSSVLKSDVAKFSIKKRICELFNKQEDFPHERKFQHLANGHKKSMTRKKAKMKMRRKGKRIKSNKNFKMFHTYIHYSLPLHQVDRTPAL